MHTRRAPYRKLIFSLICFFLFSANSVYAESASLPPAQTAPVSVKTDLKDSIARAKILVKEKKLAEARAFYQELLQKAGRPEDREKIRSEIQDLDVKILFSPAFAEDQYIYEVQPGDALYPLARKLGTTAELIQRNNRLRGNAVEPGTKLKISKAKFSIRVHKSRNTLELYRNGELFKTYPVATGRDNSTPTGEFYIKNKSVHPDWYKDGKKIPAGSPENILGTRWMGFDLPHYGIHGTTLPETIGKQASDGCIRMLNRDAEELYAIVPEKTKVTVVD